MVQAAPYTFVLVGASSGIGGMGIKELGYGAFLGSICIEISTHGAFSVVHIKIAHNE